MEILTGVEAAQAYAERTKRQEETLARHMAAGVVFELLDGVIIEPDVIIAPGAVILPGVILRGKTEIEEGCVIGPNTLISNSRIGKNCVINASQVYDSVVEAGASVGPFSHIRPQSHIGPEVHIGDFVEVKNSNIGEKTSVSHLTYIGDSDVGKGCNFGCGVVTVNYDGEKKNRTTVGDYCFVGCNSNLVAPVTLGDGAYTAAGSTITKDVPADALAVARARQENKEGWAQKKLEAYKEKKKIKQEQEHVVSKKQRSGISDCRFGQSRKTIRAHTP